AAALLKGRTVAIDATTLEANAAMRSIVRRDTGETYQEFLTRLATESGIKPPHRAALARLDRRRKKRTSNTDWKNPFDPDAKITKMKDGRTHLAHKAEHAIDLDSGAMVAVTAQGADVCDTSSVTHTAHSAALVSVPVRGADVGDTTSLAETVIAPAEQVEAAHAARPTPPTLTELIADKGYHSNQTMIDLQAVGVRSYIAEPDRGRRHWTNAPEAQRAVYGNRRRVRGARGKRLLRRRGEYVERSFAHVYDTGGMRRTHLRGHPNILKRLLIHASAFNLGILMRQVFGVGAPRRLQGQPLDARPLEIALAVLYERLWVPANALLESSGLLSCVSRRHSALAIA